MAAVEGAVFIPGGKEIPNKKVLAGIIGADNVAKYAGKHIAYLDNGDVVASGENVTEVIKQLEKQGIKGAHEMYIPK